MTYHLPGIVCAVSFDAAAEEVRNKCLDFWKIAEGYHGHEAHLMPIPKEFADALRYANDNNFLDVSVRETRSFRFDTALDDEILT